MSYSIDGFSFLFSLYHFRFIIFISVPNVVLLFQRIGKSLSKELGQKV